MNKFFRLLIAGYGAKKLGGGCFGTIIVFILIYVALGQCNKEPARANVKMKSPVSQIEVPGTLANQLIK